MNKCFFCAQECEITQNCKSCADKFGAYKCYTSNIHGANISFRSLNSSRTVLILWNHKTKCATFFINDIGKRIEHSLRVDKRELLNLINVAHKLEYFLNLI